MTATSTEVKGQARARFEVLYNILPACLAYMMALRRAAGTDFSEPTKRFCPESRSSER